MNAKRPKPKKARDVTAIPVEAPARIKPGHVRDRTLSPVAGTPKGYRVLSWPIQVAYEAGRLAARGSGQNDANSRWLAISEYCEIYETALCRSGKDSTVMDIVTSGGGFPISEAMADAIRKLVSIDSHMSRKDRGIVRKLCDGHTLPGAVRAVCGDDFEDTVAARIRDALDALDEAITAARDGGYRYVRMKL